MNTKAGRHLPSQRHQCRTNAAPSKHSSSRLAPAVGRTIDTMYQQYHYGAPKDVDLEAAPIEATPASSYRSSGSGSCGSECRSRIAPSLSSSLQSRYFFAVSMLLHGASYTTQMRPSKNEEKMHLAEPAACVAPRPSMLAGCSTYSHIIATSLAERCVSGLCTRHCLD